MRFVAWDLLVVRHGNMYNLFLVTGCVRQGMMYLFVACGFCDLLLPV